MKIIVKFNDQPCATLESQATKPDERALIQIIERSPILGPFFQYCILTATFPGGGALTPQTDDDLGEASLVDLEVLLALMNIGFSVALK